jgi:DNA-binding phage protein
MESDMNMVNRHKDFNELVAAQFEDLNFAQAYIINLINIEGLTIHQALKETIKSMGLKSFANKAGLSSQCVLDFTNNKTRLSTDSVINHLQEVFNLKTRIIIDPV